MKKISTLITFLMALSLAGLIAFAVVFFVRHCSTDADDFCEGEIIAKEFLEEKVEQQPVIITVFNGTTVVPMTIIQTYYYPARWRLTIRWYVDESFYEKQIYVTQECYETVNLGDWFVYDKSFCSYTEPCERSEDLGE